MKASRTDGNPSGHSVAPPTLKWSRAEKVTAVVVAVFLLLGIGGGIYAWRLITSPTPRSKLTPTPKPTPTPVPSPLKKASPLTGRLEDPAVADQPIFSVVIENHPDARPQAGLSQAGVVYEANAEGGITRFQAFYLDDLPATIGPVRSLRTYFVSWALEFGAPVAHAGGNADALDLASAAGLKGLNALTYYASSFYRVNTRYSPHNLYTSSDAILKALADNHWNPPSSFTPSPRQADAPAANPPHPNIHINFSYPGYRVDYAYDATANDYARSLAGAPHVDTNTGAQIHVKNVVVEYMPTSYGYTRIGEETVMMQTVGQGSGVVFRDGQAIECTWRKDSNEARTRLLDASGKDIPLDAGNTWYSIVPAGNSVSY
jgi:hypothetical protein